MNILIATDSFKDCLTSAEVASAIECGLLDKDTQLNIRKVSIADGGEGSTEAIMQSCLGEYIEVETHDPLFRRIKSRYAIISDSKISDSKTAIIEMAMTSGLELLTKCERNPLNTTTYGTGELIVDALNRGCHKIICFIGGSATNDGGIGMARALGVEFYNSSSEKLKGIGLELIDIDKIVINNIDSRIAECEITIACDVTNPLIGANGATYTYATQKGADAAMLKLLEGGMINYSNQLTKTYNKNFGQMQGGGAAGGLGAGMVAFLSGKLKRGIEIIVEQIELETQIKWADVVITGEGRMDSQTLNGKAPYEIAKLAKANNCKVIGIAGGVGDGYELLFNEYFDNIIALKNSNISMEYSIANAKELLRNINFDIYIK